MVVRYPAAPQSLGQACLCVHPRDPHQGSRRRHLQNVRASQRPSHLVFSCKKERAQRGQAIRTRAWVLCPSPPGTCAVSVRAWLWDREVVGTAGVAQLGKASYAHFCSLSLAFAFHGREEGTLRGLPLPTGHEGLLDGDQKLSCKEHPWSSLPKAGGRLKGCFFFFSPKSIFKAGLFSFWG